MELTERTFGVEIECFGKVRSEVHVIRVLKKAGLEVYNQMSGRYDNRRHWIVKDDCSISPDTHTKLGIELASPILVGKDGLKQVRKVCRVLKKLGFETNKSCGIHVHVGVRDLTASEIYTVIKRYQINETIIDSFMDKSRRANNTEYAQSVGKARWTVLRQYEAWKLNQKTGNTRQLRRRTLLISPGNAIHFMEKPKQNPFKSARVLCETADFADRFCKVNTQAYSTYGTLEFRHHHGSVCVTEITNWIKFLVNFVETSAGLTHVRNAAGETVRTPKRRRDNGVFTGLETNVKRHFESRNAA